MEWVILDVLEYECFSPTTLNFLWFYLKAVEADEELERHAKVLAISSLSHHELLCFWPSTVAAGLVVQACSAKGQRSAAERIFEVTAVCVSRFLPLSGRFRLSRFIGGVGGYPGNSKTDAARL
ncbi:cyclin-SDS isoform X1 [Nymphaea colorata]|nr:cyclin-SDS isoform X1 [Nymphaea colorata]